MERKNSVWEFYLHVSKVSKIQLLMLKDFKICEILKFLKYQAQIPSKYGSKGGGYDGRSYRDFLQVMSHYRAPPKTMCHHV